MAQEKTAKLYEHQRGFEESVESAYASLAVLDDKLDEFDNLCNSLGEENTLDSKVKEDQSNVENGGLFSYKVAKKAFIGGGAALCAGMAMALAEPYITSQFGLGADSSILRFYQSLGVMVSVAGMYSGLFGLIGCDVHEKIQEEKAKLKYKKISPHY